MRTMVNDSGNSLVVIEWIMLRNFWEYYVIDAPTNTKEIKLCYVMGLENELGDVDMHEIKPYILSKTKNLAEVKPADNYTWEN